MATATKGKRGTAASRKEAARKAKETRLLRSMKVPGLAVTDEKIVVADDQDEESKDSE